MVNDLYYNIGISFKRCPEDKRILVKTNMGLVPDTRLHQQMLFEGQSNPSALALPKSLIWAWSGALVPIF